MERDDGGAQPLGERVERGQIVADDRRRRSAARRPRASASADRRSAARRPTDRARARLSGIAAVPGLGEGGRLGGAAGAQQMAQVARRHGDMLDRPERGEQRGRPFRSRPARRGRPPRARRRPGCCAGRRAAARDRRQRLVVAAPRASACRSARARSRSSPAPRRAPARSSAVKRLALAEQPAQPRDRGMALEPARIAAQLRLEPGDRRVEPAFGELGGGPAEQDRAVERRQRDARARTGRPPAGRPPCVARASAVGDERRRPAPAPPPWSSAATAGARSSSRRWSEAEHLPHARVARDGLGAGAGERQRLGRQPAARPAIADRAEDLVGIARVGGPRAGAGAGGVAHSPSVASAGSVAAITAATAARSAGDRSGCQVSTIRMTRSASLGFSASCSIVSSKTQALPASQSRASRRRPGTSSPAARSAADGRPGGYWRRRYAAGYARPARAARTSHWAPRRGMSGWSSAAEQRHHRRAMARIGLDRDAVLDEVDRGPGLVAVERRPLPERHVVRILDIGDELGPLRRHHPVEILGDRRRRRLERRPARGRGSRS